MSPVQKAVKRHNEGFVKGPKREELRQAARREAIKEQLRRSDYREGSNIVKPGGRPEGTVARDPLKDPKIEPNAKTEHSYGTIDPGYGEVKGVPFIKEKDDLDPVAMDDVSQGRLGDCYFVAALAAIADKNPDAIRRMITDNGDGTYIVRFHEGGAVAVDNRFPLYDGEPAYAEPGDTGKEGKELWVMLIEKAWAKLKGGYEQIRGSKVSMKSRDAMEALIGNKTSTYYTARTDDDELLKVLEQASNKGLPCTAGTYSKKHFDEATLEEMDKKGVHPNHAYAVVRVDQKKKTIELYNPWGKEYARPNLTVAEFKRYYQVVHVNAK